METSQCSIEGCEKTNHANGLCEKHYRRQRRHGDPAIRLRPEGRRTCSVDGCDRNAYSGGLCKLHARRLAATGNARVASIFRNSDRLCSVEGCGRPYSAKGLCRVHYHRNLRHGEPGEAKIAPSGAALQFLEKAFNWNSDKCLEWPYQCKDGYARISAWHGLGTNVCRIICERVNGKPPSRRHQAAHSCGNGDKGCINPVHLNWRTQKQNGAERKIHKGDRGGRGSRHHLAKLDEHQVRQIRTMLPVMQQKEIAEIFGVGNDTISAISRGKSWGWLK